jgi:hypothetical protein
VQPQKLERMAHHQYYLARVCTTLLVASLRRVPLWIALHIKTNARLRIVNSFPLLLTASPCFGEVMERKAAQAGLKQNPKGSDKA